MITSTSDSYLIILNKIHSTNRKIKNFKKEQSRLSAIISALEEHRGYAEADIMVTKAQIDDLLKTLENDLIDLKNQKSSHESVGDFSGIESKFNDAVKIEEEIKGAASDACKSIYQKWKALSHPSLDPMAWIRHWVEKAAEHYGVEASASTTILIEYKKFIPQTHHGNLYPSTILKRKAFTLADIVTNRYRLDRDILNASGTETIRWDESYPKAFTDKMLSGTIESDHDAALTEHIGAPGTIDNICDYLQGEIVAAAWEYLKDPKRDQQYQELVKNFLSRKTGAKPVYADGKILDRVFLIQGGDVRADRIWGVLFSLTNKNPGFLELPKSRSELVRVIEQNYEWLRSHLSFSDRRNAAFVREFCFNPTPFYEAPRCTKSILLSTPETAASEYTLKEVANNLTNNLISTVRSKIDYMTTTNAELWIDWVGDVAAFVGIVATLALVPASILGAPHMVAAGFLTAATTAVLPNIAKIAVHKDAATRISSAKEIVVAITLEAIGFGISKAAARIGAGIAQSGTHKLGQEAAELISTEIRTAITRSIGQKPLKLTPTSIGENLYDMLNFIDDADIALEMVRNSTENTASWKKFGLELTDRELDSFMLKWGNHNALESGNISKKAKLLIRTADTASSIGTKSVIDGNIDHGTRTSAT